MESEITEITEEVNLKESGVILGLPKCQKDDGQNGIGESLKFLSPVVSVSCRSGTGNVSSSAMERSTLFTDLESRKSTIYSAEDTNISPSIEHSVNKELLCIKNDASITDTGSSQRKRRKFSSLTSSLFKEDIRNKKLKTDYNGAKFDGIDLCIGDRETTTLESGESAYSLRRKPKVDYCGTKIIRNYIDPLNKSYRKDNEQSSLWNVNLNRDAVVGLSEYEQRELEGLDSNEETNKRFYRFDINDECTNENEMLQAKRDKNFHSNLEEDNSTDSLSRTLVEKDSNENVIDTESHVKRSDKLNVKNKNIDKNGPLLEERQENPDLYLAEKYIPDCLDQMSQEKGSNEKLTDKESLDSVLLQNPFSLDFSSPDSLRMFNRNDITSEQGKNVSCNNSTETLPNVRLLKEIVSDVLSENRDYSEKVDVPKTTDGVSPACRSNIIPATSERNHLYELSVEGKLVGTMKSDRCGPMEFPDKRNQEEDSSEGFIPDIKISVKLMYLDTSGNRVNIPLYEQNNVGMLHSRISNENKHTHEHSIDRTQLDGQFSGEHTQVEILPDNVKFSGEKLIAGCCFRKANEKVRKVTSFEIDNKEPTDSIDTNGNHAENHLQDYDTSLDMNRVDNVLGESIGQKDQNQTLVQATLDKFFSVVKNIPSTLFADVQTEKKTQSAETLTGKKTQSADTLTEKKAQSADTQTGKKTQTADTQSEKKTQFADASSDNKTQSADTQTEKKSQSADTQSEKKTQSADTLTVKKTQSTDTLTEKKTQSADSQTEKKTQSADGEVDKKLEKLKKESMNEHVEKYKKAVLSVGEVVWGKFGKAWWPALVVSGEIVRRAPKEGYIWLFWLSDSKISQVKPSDVDAFQNKFNSRCKEKRSRSMRYGIEKALEICAVRADIDTSEFGSLEDWTKSDKGFLHIKAKRFRPDLEYPVPNYVLRNLKGIPDSEQLTNTPHNQNILAKHVGSTGQYGASTSSNPGSSGLINHVVHEESAADQIWNDPDVDETDLACMIENTCIACSTEVTDGCSHPLFEGKICGNCKRSLKESFYAEDDDGCSMFCCVCGEGGDLYLCSNNDCGKAYCFSCVEKHTSRATMKKIDETKYWKCFLCTEYSRQSHGNLIPHKEWSLEVVKFFQTNRVSMCSDLQYLKNGGRRKLRVLSLFDGIGTGKVALDELGLDVDVYYASEINPDALLVANFHHCPVQLGDIWDLSPDKLEELCPIDLVLAGPPCNDLSIVNPDRKGFGGTGILVWRFAAVLKDIQMICKTTNHVFWLMENTASMLTEYRKIISKQLEMEPVVWDAKHFTGQRRARCFWGNIPGMFSTPEFCKQLEKDKKDLSSALISNCNRKARVSHTRTITSSSNSLSITNGVNNPLVMMNGEPDHIWLQELERLFGFPTHYTDVGHLTREQRRKLIGKAWSVPVIKHLLSPLKQYFKVKET